MNLPALIEGVKGFIRRMKMLIKGKIELYKQKFYMVIGHSQYLVFAYFTGICKPPQIAFGKTIGTRVIFVFSKKD